ncbi:MAG: MerR family transcriptional regulator, partial [Planctomycetes bacterium]|nr:MerR family transcriptional regulator [Planctomycetota bacterium]
VYMKAPKVSSKDILEKTGISSIKTLTRWYQRGLIPPPEIGTHPAGRGKLAYWPEWVLERCLTIRKLTRAKKSLDEVQHLLSCEWADEERKWKKKQRKWKKKRRGEYDLAAASEQLLYDQCVISFLEAADDKISPMLADKYHQKLGRRLNSEMAKIALKHVQAGFNPVLVFDGDELSIVPDFLVTQLLSNAKGGLQSLVVVPIFDEVVTSFSPCDIGLPSAPTVTPVARVREGDTSKELTVIAIDKWDFELVDQAKQHKRRGETEEVASCKKRRQG